MEILLKRLGSEMEAEELRVIEHEICTCLNAIIGFSEIMQNNDVGSKLKNEYLQHIIYSSKKLLEITNKSLNRIV